VRRFARGGEPAIGDLVEISKFENHGLRLSFALRVDDRRQKLEGNGFYQKPTLENDEQSD
jgi:hypothetical protein